MADDILHDLDSRANRPWNPNLDPEKDHLYPGDVHGWRDFARRFFLKNGPARVPGPSKKYPENGALYFLKDRHGAIKIGATTNFPKRLKELSYRMREALTVLCVVDGASNQERDYQKRFREHRIKGEWFHPHPDILAEIERLNTGANQ